jgi:hypothetical protein
MKFQHIALTGLALVVVAVLFATPSFARHRHVSRNYHHATWTHRERARREYRRTVWMRSYRHPSSSPIERAQTRTLNYRVAREGGFTANGETGLQARRENIVARQRYKQALDAYGDERRQFETEMNFYRARIDYYYLHRRQPSEWWLAEYAATSRGGLDQLPRSALLGDEIDEPDGRVIGQVVDVHLYPAAHIARVEVAFKGGGVAWVDAASLRYDAEDRVVFSDIPADDLREASLPGSE